MSTQPNKPSSSSSTTQKLSSNVPDILPTIKSYLSVNWPKITNFWLYADWRIWARFELYVHLEQTLCHQLRDEYPRRDYSVSHSVPMFGDDEDTPVVDLTISPATPQLQNDMKDVAVWICAARPTENDTSYGEFVDKFRTEWEVVTGLVEKVRKKYGDEDDFTGVGRLLFLGIGEKAYSEEELLEFGELKPERFGFGGETEYEAAVWVYYKWLDLVEAKTGDGDGAGREKEVQKEKEQDEEKKMETEKKG